MVEPPLPPSLLRAEVAVAAALDAMAGRPVDTSRDARAARRAEEVVRAILAARAAPDPAPAGER